jgi:hypothetical protein
LTACAVIGNAQGLDFIVLDELHTYRGRQGADVAMLMRRVRDRLAARDLPASKRCALLEAVAIELREHPKFSDTDLDRAMRNALAAIRERPSTPSLGD